MADKTAATAAPAVVEETKNCASCNKPMKRSKRYYRNGKYYCNKNCFKNKGDSGDKKE
jgi:formylmethanofuran dehydrogenase subunit E